MKKVNVAFGIHNHQPVGNFDFVFEDAYDKAYLPFFEVLERHPKIRLAQHYTGILFEWLEANKPDFLNRLQRLVARGQVEMMTGGFYEPITSVIPDRDKVGQIRKQTAFVKQHFGQEPEGMWVAERIWEPQLPRAFSEAGVKYVVLDDSHFKNSGLRGEDLYGYYVTEEAGHAIFLFPICEKLRYTIPFAPPQDTIDFLKDVATQDGDRLVVFADDGEKFGIWPKTHEHCYQDGWLEAFFQAIEANLDWINLLHPGEVLQAIPPTGRVYLPTSSYREMMEWAMPTAAIHEYEALEQALKQHELHEQYKAFIRGGFWRNFMAKYPESNNMHKKMLHVSRRVARLSQSHADHETFIKAQDHLWAGQCNCPYWHGVFGGLYLNHLRYANYHELIQAEALLDQLEHDEGKWLEHTVTDFDCDGHDEILISNPRLNLYAAPNQGGGIFELDFKPAAINLLDTLTRREEAYHKKLIEATDPARKKADHNDEEGVASIHDIVIMKEEGLEKKLFYDAYRRIGCLDHFLTESTTLADFERCQYEEAGDFLQASYEHAIETADGLLLHLWRDGNVGHADTRIPVHLSKKIRLDDHSSRIQIQYAIKNLDTSPRRLRFGSEWDFALLAGDAPDRYFDFFGHKLKDKRLCSSGEVRADEAKLVDEWLKLEVSLKVDKRCLFWRFPIETISQSEGGFERVYQSSVIMPLWDLLLKPEETWEAEIEIVVAQR